MREASSPPTEAPDSRWQALQPRALWLAVSYALAGSAWIFGSDRLLLVVAPDATTLSALSQGKGIAFVLLTTLLVYAIAAHAPEQIAGESTRPAHPAPRSFARSMVWVFVLLTATLVLAGMVGLAHSGRELGELRFERLQDLALLRAERIAAWQSGLADSASSPLATPAAAGPEHEALVALLAMPAGSSARLRLLVRDGQVPRLWDPLGRQSLLLPPTLPSASASASDSALRLTLREPDGRPLLAAMAAVAGTRWAVVASTRHGALLDMLTIEAVLLALVNAFALAAAATVLLSKQRRSERADEAERRRIWQLLEGIADSSSDAIYAKDAQGCYLFANREACRVVGKTAAQLLGRDTSVAFPSDEAQGIREADRLAMESAQPIHGEFTLSTTEGPRTYLSTKARLLDAAGKVIGMFGISRDITELRRQQQMQRLWAMAFESTRDGVMIANGAGRIEAVNAAFSAITGYTSEEAVGQTPRLLHSGRHDAAFYAQMWQAIQEHGHWRGEIWNRRRNGEVYPEWLTISAVRDEAGEISHFVGVFTDISRVKQHEAELEQLAHYDSLTGLPNRLMLHERLAEVMAHASRRERQGSGSRIALLFIDLDGFKTVNDSLGHPAGDELLVCMVRRLRARLRQDDLLGRLGGDEFLVIVEDAGGAEEIVLLARDLLATLAAPVPLSCGSDAYVTASIGISIHPDDGGETAVELLRDADTAMYRAKALGRNRFCFFTSDMNADALARLELEAALSQALARGELLLHYQPKVDAASGDIVGAEALLRWNRGGSGPVPPGQFIPIAEQSSLILEIGSWVIEESCRQLRAWMDAGQVPVPIAVNVTARQFASGDLPAIVTAALRRHRVPASCLEIELTEGMLMADPAAASALLQQIRALGVKLSLDDFGTGYSSLAYLQQFPLDALKIDQSFVRRIGEQPDGAAIVDAVIALAHRLRLRVVAEGVETAAQRDYLRSQGCDELQGYHFGRPGPAAALQALLG